MPSLPKVPAAHRVTFANGNCARLIDLKRHHSPAYAAAALGLARPGAVILLCGGAQLQESLQPRVRELLTQAIVPFAIANRALLIDGGTDAGVMALLGQAVAAAGEAVPLLGVAPNGRVSYPGAERADAYGCAPLEPNHSHFLIVEGARWGDETEAMYATATLLARGLPILVVLAGGGEVSRTELLLAGRHGLHTIVLAGTGR